MKLLVTGGAGFIGSEFVRQAVKAGYTVTCVDKLTYAGDIRRLKEVINDIKFYQVDLVDFTSAREVFKKENPEVVVHFAAESHVDRSILAPREFLDSNILGSFNLLELSKEYRVERFINISTDEVYGEIKDGKFKEDSPLLPNSPYSVSKAAQDMLGRAYFRTFGVPVITVRPSNNYGAWQYPEKFIPVVIVKAMKNEEIPIYGKGDNIRQWLYVSDCVEAIIKIMEKGKVGEIYNVASQEEKKNIDVAKEILRILGKSEDLITFVKDRPGHDYRYSMDTSKIENEIGWKAKTGFEEGLRKTVAWYLENFDWVENKLIELKKYWEKVYIK